MGSQVLGETVLPVGQHPQRVRDSQASTGLSSGQVTRSCLAEGRAGLEVMGYRNFWDPLGTECKEGRWRQAQKAGTARGRAAGAWTPQRGGPSEGLSPTLSQEKLGS